MAEEDTGDFSWVWAAEGSTRLKIKCRFCPKVTTGISRFKSHLSCIKGGGISECPNVPPEVKKKCALWRRQTDEENASKKRAKQSTTSAYTQGAGRNVQAVYGSSGGSHSVEGGSSHVQGGEANVVEEGTVSGSCRSPKSQKRFNNLFNVAAGTDIFESFTTPGAQPTLPGMGAWQKDLHDGARKVISQFFYACAIPYNVAAHPLFQLSFDAAIACGKGFKAPTPYQLAGPLLDQCVDDIKQIVESHKAHWERYGCSIMADGWTTSTGL